MPMNDIRITRGNFHYTIPAGEHRAAAAKVRSLPKMLETIAQMSQCFIGKPQFVIEHRGDMISVFREDYRDRLIALSANTRTEPGKRLSVSEWEVYSKYRGNEPEGRTITLHDVFSRGGVTIKTGNPLCNNAYEEFYRALFSRCAGIVEAKSPLGFVFWQDDIHAQKAGLMFYKHINGVDLDRAVGSEADSVLNWALWEAGKFFSRLINARLYLEDADRLGNNFIEKNQANRVFRFLDLERVYPVREYTNEKKAEMLANFGRRAIERGWLTQEKLGEFIIVGLGVSSTAAGLVRQALEPAFR